MKGRIRVDEVNCLIKGVARVGLNFMVGSLRQFGSTRDGIDERWEGQLGWQEKSGRMLSVSMIIKAAALVSSLHVLCS